jgi:hypothetical protein
MMSIETGVQLAELRDLTHHNIEQLNRAVAGWIEFARKALDAAETNVTACCDHARQLAQAQSPVECMKLHSEFLKSSVASMQKQSTDMMRVSRSAATE